MKGGIRRIISSKLADKEESYEMKFGLARVMKYEELKKATNSFAEVLGQGAYGSVYLGTLLDGQMVAVKVLLDGNPKRIEQFFNEVTVLSRVRHKNLISLHGCTDPTSRNLLLVYEYMPNGTVAYNLHLDESSLSWAMRIQIAVETAEALAYLHGLEPPIIHRDVKTSNILLDHGFHVKVADLGMCCPLPWDAMHVSTMPQGTMGYRDPEYDNYSRLTDKTDVYSFGVVLLELISGQHAVDVNRDLEDTYLDIMAIDKIINNKLEDFVDPKLDYHSNDVIKEMIDSIARLAGECLQPTGNMRPSMVQVVTVLKGIQNKMELLGLNDDQDRSRDRTPLEVLDMMKMLVIPLAELSRLTGNFGQEAFIGEGSSYCAFKAILSTGQPAAIMKPSPNAISLNTDYAAPSKVHFLGRLSHPNLVKLLGYCFEDNELLLAYEFMGKGSLEYHLFRRAAPDPLSWDVRLKIAIGAARGLAFLHSSKKQVIYRDFTASNILLDSYYNAKLSDSLLATYGPTGGMSYIETQVIGTCGYADPEYIATGCLYVKSDVYGFGVVMLEMLTGKRVLNRNRPIGEHNLVDWAKPYLADSGKLVRLMDPRLEGQYPLKGAFQAAQLTLKCLAEEHINRPSMKEVVETLEHIEVHERSIKKTWQGLESTTMDKNKYSSMHDGHTLKRLGYKAIHHSPNLQ